MFTPDYGKIDIERIMQCRVVRNLMTSLREKIIYRRCGLIQKRALITSEGLRCDDVIIFHTVFNRWIDYYELTP